MSPAGSTNLRMLQQLVRSVGNPAGLKIRKTIRLSEEKPATAQRFCKYPHGIQEGYHLLRRQNVASYRLPLRTPIAR